MSDPSQFLNEFFLGDPQTNGSAFDGLFEGTVVSATATEVVVTVNGFDRSGKATFTCKYERRPGASPAHPPAGTACLVAFAGSIVASVLAPGYAGSPWAVAFTGWP